jgi:large repetitive protein
VVKSICGRRDERVIAVSTSRWFLKMVVAAIAIVAAPIVYADSDPYPASYNWTPDPVPTVPVATVANNVTFTIQFSNSGPSASPAGVGGTVATIAVPPGIRVANDGGTGTNYPTYCALSGAYPAVQQLVCELGSLPVGANVLTLTYGGTALDVGSGTAATSVTVAQTDADPNPGNETLNRTVTLQTGADLQIGLSASAPSLPAGALLTYTLSPTNAGPGNSNAMRVTMNLPPTTDFSACQNISSPT